MSATKQAPVMAWLSSLADLTAAPSEDKPTPAKFRLYAQMLGDFPPAAFTAASLKAIASAAEFFPRIGPLRDRLQAWLNQTAPPRAAVQQPAVDPGIAATSRWFSAWPGEDDNAGWTRRRMAYWERDNWSASLTIDENLALRDWMRTGNWNAIMASVIAEHPPDRFYGSSFREAESGQ